MRNASVTVIPKQHIICKDVVDYVAKSAFCEVVVFMSTIATPTPSFTVHA